jgi:protein SCO1
MVPHGLVFRDESGGAVRLGDYFGNRPTILVLIYYQCPMLCTMVLHNLLQTMCEMPESAGKDYDVLTVSFDPRDTPQLARAKKQNFLAQYGRPGAADGLHFLTGDQPSITKLTDAVGFRYVWLPQYQQFAHASGIIILTPQGKISRYFFGVNYQEDDLRLALTEASDGHTGSVVDSILLLCCSYNPTSGTYNWAVARFLKAGGAVLILILCSLIAYSMCRGRAVIPATKTPAHPSGSSWPDDSASRNPSSSARS